jgi:hypothetical protein
MAMMKRNLVCNFKENNLWRAEENNKIIPQTYVELNSMLTFRVYIKIPEMCEFIKKFSCIPFFFFNLELFKQIRINNIKKYVKEMAYKYKKQFGFAQDFFLAV